MAGTLIFVDIPNTVSTSKSQSSVALATSSSDPDLSRQLVKKDSRRNQTIGVGRGVPISFATKLQKSRQQLDLKSTDSHLPTIKPRVLSLITSEPISPPASSRDRQQEAPATPLSHDSISATPIISESHDSSAIPSFPSFSYSSTSTNSYQPPELISIGTCDCVSPTDNYFPQPASDGSFNSSEYYSSYSPSGSRTVRVGRDSLLHRSKSLFSLKRPTLKSSSEQLHASVTENIDTTQKGSRPMLEGLIGSPSRYPTPRASLPSSSTSASSSVSQEEPLLALPQHATPIQLDASGSDLAALFSSSPREFASESFRVQTKQGYLTKQGKIVKNWKRRWFKLEQTYAGDVLLCYYRYPEDLRARGKIPLVAYLDPDTCTQHHTNRQLCFRLRDSNRVRDYYICADTEGEMQDWMDAIKVHTLHMDW